MSFMANSRHCARLQQMMAPGNPESKRIRHNDMIRRTLVLGCSLWFSGPAFAQSPPGAGGPMSPVSGSSAAQGANSDITALNALRTIGPSTYTGCFWSDVDSCTPTNVRLRERVFIGSAFNLTDAAVGASVGTWFPQINSALYLARDAQLLVMSDAGGIGISGMSRGAGHLSPYSDPIGVAAFGYNDTTDTTTSAFVWASYSECYNTGTYNQQQCYGHEIDAVNMGASVTSNPYATNREAYGLWLAAGGAHPGVNPSGSAITIVANGTTWNQGIVFLSTAVTADANGNMVDVAFPKGGLLQWYTGAGVLAGSITSDALNAIKLGGLDQAAPAAQTLTVQNVIAGGATTNTAGAAMTIQGSLGVGTGAGGNILMKTGTAGSTGAVQNALYTAMTMFGSAQNIVLGAGNAVNFSNSVVNNPKVVVTGNGGPGNNAFGIVSYGTSSTSPGSLILAQSRGGLNVQVALNSGDLMGQVLANGSDGTKFQDSARIAFKTSGTISAGIVPGQIEFDTATAAGTLTAAMVIQPTQLITLPAITTGTTVAAVCLDSGNNLVKKVGLTC